LRLLLILEVTVGTFYGYTVEHFSSHVIMQLVSYIIYKYNFFNIIVPSMMTVYLATLISLLFDCSSLGKTNSFSRSMHEHCIQRITAIGPLYKETFKVCMTQHPNLKVKLAEGIKANSTIKKTPTKSITPSQPQIKLKMNFSNFN